jgi:hypothetical protein
MSSMPHNVYNAAAVAVDNFLFIIGGWINAPTANVIVYDDRSDRNQCYKTRLIKIDNMHVHICISLKDAH